MKRERKGKERTGDGAPLTTLKGSFSSMRAIVTKVCRGEPGGDYLVCRPENDSVLPVKTSVTVSLKNWSGSPEPQPGQVAELSEISEFRGGWRAATAMPVNVEQQRKAAGGTRGK